MKLLKWIWELVNELAKGLTQSGYEEVLPEDLMEGVDMMPLEDDDAHREKYFEQVRQELENK
tara:strand:- start:192 stop:377 length:186 start_codon:yes stop_codon:yes gene_type:complete